MSKKDIDKNIDLGELDYVVEEGNLNSESNTSEQGEEIFDEKKDFRKKTPIIHLEKKIK